jgi:antitoxin component of RelBE/YafQ-DinJ toxin-antitoxin module
MNKTEVIRFRTTTGEKAAITAQADSEGITLTAIIRIAVSAYMAENKTPYKYSDITMRLGEIGYNAKEIIIITDWWNYREHGEWLMTASRADIYEASEPAFRGLSI